MEFDSDFFYSDVKQEKTGIEKVETSVIKGQISSRLTDEGGRDRMAARAYSRVKGMWFTACKMSLIPAVPDDVARSRSAADIAVDRLPMVLSDCMIANISLSTPGADRIETLTNLCSEEAMSAIELLNEAGIKNLLQLYQCDIHEVEGLHPWTKDRIIEMLLQLAGIASERTPVNKDRRKGHDEKAI